MWIRLLVVVISGIDLLASTGMSDAKRNDIIVSIKICCLLMDVMISRSLWITDYYAAVRRCSAKCIDRLQSHATIGIDDARDFDGRYDGDR